MSELGSIASGNPLYDLVRQGESGPAGYNAFNRGTHREHDRDVLNPIGNVRHEPITTSTCGEIENRQSPPTNDATRLGALGQYQISAPTFERAEVDLQLRRSDVFDQNLEDRILSESLLWHAPHVAAYIEGRPGSTREGAQAGLARQWASFSDPQSGNFVSRFRPPANHASISLEASAAALDTLRARYGVAYKAAVQSHDSDPENAAWRNATAIPPEQRERWDRIQGPAAKPGDNGPAVTELQGELNRARDATDAPLAATGSYDHQTTAAIQAFQRAHALTVDGIAGSKTRLALAAAAGDVLAQRPIAGARHPEEAVAANPRIAAPAARAQTAKPVESVAARSPWSAIVRDAEATGAAAHAVEAPATHTPRHRTEPPAPSPALATGATGGAVRVLQRDLNADGARDHAGQRLHADGVFGQRTGSAVRSFQQAHGLVPDGIVGQQTHIALDAARVRPSQAGVARDPHGSHDYRATGPASSRQHPTSPPANSPSERPPVDDHRSPWQRFAAAACAMSQPDEHATYQRVTPRR